MSTNELKTQTTKNMAMGGNFLKPSYAKHRQCVGKSHQSSNVSNIRQSYFLLSFKSPRSALYCSKTIKKACNQCSAQARCKSTWQEIWFQQFNKGNRNQQISNATDSFSDESPVQLRKEHGCFGTEIARWMKSPKTFKHRKRCHKNQARTNTKASSLAHDHLDITYRSRNPSNQHGVTTQWRLLKTHNTQK